jgi:hypothetical protein
MNSMIQEITVSTKGGFISALECARQGGVRINRALNDQHIDLRFENEFDTLITLKRKSGNTTYYYKAGVLGKTINRAKKLAKRMSAADLLA